MSAPAEQVTDVRHVLIVAGRFAGVVGRLLGSGAQRATVDLGVPIDGGSGVVVVPVSAVREVRR